MRLPIIHNAIFYTAGLVTSVASAFGTGNYLMHETGGDVLLAGSAATALGAAIYFGWDVVFNHKGVRRLPALAMAITLSAVSTWTIYQNNWLPEQQRQQQIQQQKADENKAGQAEAKATIKQQQADIRAALGDLNRLQDTDRAMIAGRVAMVKKGIRPNANNAAISKAREAMDTRRQRITELQNQLSGLTEQLLVMTTLAVAEVNSQSIVQSDTVNIPRLARASLYDVMTMLFLLLGSWYRSQQAVKDSLTTAGLGRAISQLNSAAEIAEAKRTGALQVAEELEQRIQKAIYTCNESLADATEALTGVREAVTTTSEQLSDKAAIILLENRRIKANGKGNLTAAIIQKATGWGRPRAKQLLEDAHAKGILARTAHGNAWVYSYPSKQEQQTELPDNVFQLSNTRTA